MSYSSDIQRASGFSTESNPVRGLLLWKWVTGLAGFFERWSDRVPAFAFGIAVVVLMLLSIRFAKGGFAHTEAEQYIPHYLSERTLLQKVYDVEKVEIDPTMYQPRVLSYMVDNLDVAFIAWSTRHGYPHFISASHYLFWGGDCVLLWFYFRYRLRVNRCISGLLICLFSTDPMVFTNVTYFRSAKSGATFFLLCAFIALGESFRLRLRSSRNIQSAALACLGGVLLLCACLFDEIPVAFSFAAVLALSLEWVLSRDTCVARAAVLPLMTTLAVLLTYAWYDLVLHPKIAFAVTGRKVIFEYQSGTLHELLRQPVLTLIGSVSVFTDTFGYLLGGVSGTLGLLAMILLVSMWQAGGTGQMRQQPRLARLMNQKAVIRVLFAGILMLGCIYGMASRHPPLMWTDVRRGYYVLPLSMVFLMFVAATAGTIVRRRYVAVGFVDLVLSILVASNVILLATGAVFNHTGDIARADMRSPAYTRILLDELRKNPESHPGLSRNPEIARVQKQILNSPVYKALTHSVTGDTASSKYSK